MKFKNYVNSLTGDNRIYSLNDITQMALGDVLKNKEELLSQYRVLGVPTESELQNSDNVVYVKAYTRDDGTEVRAHWRSKPGEGNTITKEDDNLTKDSSGDLNTRTNSVNTQDDNYVNESMPEIAGVKCGKPMTPEQAGGKNVNPNYDSGDIGYKQNCVASCAVYLARLKGYNLETLPRTQENAAISSILARNPFYAFKEPDGGVMKGRYDIVAGNSKDFYKKIDGILNTGEIYILKCSPIETKAKWLHAVVVEKNKNGEIEVYDAQSGKVYGKEFFNTLQYEGELNGEYGKFPQSLYRVDNKDLNTDVFSKISKRAQRQSI